MVTATISIPENEHRILNIIKAKYGFKNKEQTIIFLLQEYEKQLEPEIRPEYLEKLKKIDKEGYGKTFSSIKELRDIIERKKNV